MSSDTDAPLDPTGSGGVVVAVRPNRTNAGGARRSGIADFLSPVKSIARERRFHFDDGRGSVPLDTGGVIGYTMGDPGFPSIYYKKGRYTSAHKNRKNVGWHPHEIGKEHYRVHLDRGKYGRFKAKYGGREGGLSPTSTLGCP